jgi:hypothetical protein
VRGRLLLALLLVVASLPFLARALLPEDRPEPDRHVSFLAVGDTGMLVGPDASAARRAVGDGLAREDRRAPASLLVLLGNTFGPGGLVADDLEEQVREDVVRPFCPFVDLAGPRSSAVADACRLPAGERHALPILALFGGLEHRREESADLEMQGVPAFVPNWRVPRGLVEVQELEPGLSLVLIDSQKILHRPGERAPRLVEALQQAHGPWRVVLSHDSLRPHEEEGPRERAVNQVRQAVARAGAPVHLWLSGSGSHLGLYRGKDGDPALFVSAGSSSDALPPPHAREALFASTELGFAQVDLRASPRGDRLGVTLYSVGRPGATHLPEPLATALVDRSGDVELQRAPGPLSRWLRRLAGR